MCVHVAPCPYTHTYITHSISPCSCDTKVLVCSSKFREWCTLPFVSFVGLGLHFDALQSLDYSFRKSVSVGLLWAPSGLHGRRWLDLHWCSPSWWESVYGVSPFAHSILEVLCFSPLRLGAVSWSPCLSLVGFWFQVVVLPGFQSEGDREVENLRQVERSCTSCLCVPYEAMPTMLYVNDTLIAFKLKWHRLLSLACWFRFPDCLSLSWVNVGMPKLKETYVLYASDGR